VVEEAGAFEVEVDVVVFLVYVAGEEGSYGGEAFLACGGEGGEVVCADEGAGGMLHGGQVAWEPEVVGVVGELGGHVGVVENGVAVEFGVSGGDGVEVVGYGLGAADADVFGQSGVEGEGKAL